MLTTRNRTIFCEKLNRAVAVTVTRLEHRNQSGIVDRWVEELHECDSAVECGCTGPSSLPDFNVCLMKPTLNRKGHR